MGGVPIKWKAGARAAEKEGTAAAAPESDGTFADAGGEGEGGWVRGGDGKNRLEIMDFQPSH